MGEKKKDDNPERKFSLENKYKEAFTKLVPAVVQIMQHPEVRKKKFFFKNSHNSSNYLLLLSSIASPF